MKLNSVIEIYTDGACRGNPGIGSWAAWLKYGKLEKKISGVEPYTTNNQMELKAPISALLTLKKDINHKINIHTDSKYVREGIVKWIHNWKRNNWQIAEKKRIKNLELWKQLYELDLYFKPSWHWVKGHSGDYGNDLVDALANQAIDDFLKKDTE